MARVVAKGVLPLGIAALAAGGCFPMTPTYQTAHVLPPGKSAFGMAFQAMSIRESDGYGQRVVVPGEADALLTDLGPEMWYRRGVAPNVELGLRWRASALLLPSAIEGDVKVRAIHAGPLSLAVDLAGQAYVIAADAQVTAIATLDLGRSVSLTGSLLGGIGDLIDPPGGMSGCGGWGDCAATSGSAGGSYVQPSGEEGTVVTRGGSLGLELRFHWGDVLPAVQWERFDFPVAAQHYTSLGGSVGFTFSGGDGD